MSRITRIAARWGMLVVAVLVWQAWADWRRSAFFPAPSAILAQMYDLWFSGPASHLWLTSTAVGNVLPSLARVGAGLGIGIVVGGPLGIAIGRSPALSGYVYPLVNFGRSLPTVALTAVFIVLFKIGTEMEVAYIAFGTVWPILLNTIDGARTVDPVQMEIARVFRLSADQRLTRLIVPATLPKFFAGLRLAVSLALVLMVIAELVGTNGIGYEMNSASQNFDLTELWSGIVLLGILGYVLNAVVLGVEHYALAWYRGARRLTT